MRGLEPSPPSRRGEASARGMITVLLGADLRKRLHAFIEKRYPGSQSDFIREATERYMEEWRLLHEREKIERRFVRERRGSLASDEQYRPANVFTPHDEAAYAVIFKRDATATLYLGDCDWFREGWNAPQGLSVLAWRPLREGEEP